jgi:hypothetical protein
MPDTTIYSTRVLQAIAQDNTVNTTMDTCQFTLYNPNLAPVVGPLALVAVSTGIYQYTIPVGLLDLPGTWATVWYTQYSVTALHSTFTFTVGD